jgi:hypothetical protein
MVVVAAVACSCSTPSRRANTVAASVEEEQPHRDGRVGDEAEALVASFGGVEIVART